MKKGTITKYFASKNGSKISLVVIVISVIIMLITLGFNIFDFSYLKKTKAEDLTISYTSEIKEKFNTIINATNILEMYVKINNGNDNFEKMVNEFFKKYPEINHVALAPDGVISMTIPNSKALFGNGKDLLFYATTKDFANYSKETKKTVFIDPYEFQNNKYISLLRPVYLNNDSGESFWGFVVVTVDFDKLINSSELKGIANSKYQIIKNNPDGESTVILGNTNKVRSPQIINLDILESDLTLKISFPIDRFTVFKLVFYAIAVLLSETLIMLLFLIAFDVLKQKNNFEKVSYIDFLTKLPNRRSFIDHINYLMGNYSVSNEPFALLYMDLDGFKTVNDTYGHEAGDEILISVSKTFKKTIRSNDYVFRLGGDEFVIILRNMNKKENCEAFIKKLTLAVKQPIIINNKKIKVGLSVGVSFFPKDGMNEDEIITKADTAMYKAKLKTRKNYEFTK